MVSTGWSLLIWLLIFLIVAFIAYKMYIHWFSAIVIGLIVATIVLALIARPTANSFIQGAGTSTSAALYWVIMFVVPLIVLIYSIYKAVTDRDHTRANAHKTVIVEKEIPVY